MHSMKPGRGPSIMGGVAGVFAAIFGLIWMVAAAKMGAPWPFVLFGLVFIGFAVSGAIYNFYNAGAKNRLSAMDIVDESEEPDPLNAKVSGKVSYCSACGVKIIKSTAKFCSHCGIKL
jgi:hypothetical protein